MQTGAKDRSCGDFISWGRVDAMVLVCTTYPSVLLGWGMRESIGDLGGNNTLFVCLGVVLLYLIILLSVFYGRLF